MYHSPLLSRGLAGAFLLYATATAHATPLTWADGGSASWATPANWSPAQAPVNADLLTFDSAAGTTSLTQDIATLTSLGAITFNATAAAYVISGTTAMTVTGNLAVNSANTQALVMPLALNAAGSRSVTVAAGGKLSVGSSATAYAHSVNNGSIAVSGNGELEVLSIGNFQVSTGAATTFDMSALATFTAGVGTLRVGNITASVSATTRLATANSITAATSLLVGANSASFNSSDILRLGTNNSINTPTIVIGQHRSSGTLNFDTGLTNPSVTIKGASGGASQAAMLLGNYDTSNTAQTPTGTVNFTGGSVTAQFSSLILGQQNPNGTSPTAAATGTGNFTLDGATSSVAVDTVRLGYWAGSRSPTAANVLTATGNLTIVNGAVTVGTALRVADQGSFGALTGNANTRSNGTLTLSGGVLDVSGAFVLADRSGSLGGATSDAKGVLAINGGTVNTHVDITTNNAQSTLILNGGTLDMKGCKIGSAAQPIGGNSGALTLQSGALQNVADINGGAALNKTGGGTLTLAGTNTYPGLTTVTTDTLKCTTPHSLYNDDVAGSWTPAKISVAAGATLAFNVGGASEFTAGDVTTLLTNLTSVANNGLQAGSNIGFDTTNADGLSFTVTDLIANSTGSGAGSLGVAKLGTNTLVLANANTYSGATTVVAGTLAPGTAAAIANSSPLDIRSGATLDVSAFGGWSMGATQTLKGTGTLLGNATTAGTVAPGSPLGTLTASGNFTFTSGASFAPAILGVQQVETATPTAKTATADGMVAVTVTGAGIAGSPLTITVPILNLDTGVAWAAKVRSALAATPAISALYNVGGNPATRDITLTRLTAEANDASLNIAVANGTPSPGITATPTSANTTAGAATANSLFAVTGTLNISEATLNLTTSGPLVAPAFILATYGSRSGFFATVTGLPAGYAIDYAYNSGTAIAITDTTAPAWVSGWPKVDTVTTTTFTARVETNETGNAWFVVLAAGTAAPSPAQVKAGLDGTSAPALTSGTTVLTANTEAACPVTGLSPGTSYDVWFVAQDGIAPPNVQTSPLKLAITTDGPPVWVTGWPKVDGISTTGFTARAEINKAGSGYFVVLANDAPAPNSAQVKAGQDSTGAAAITTGSLALSANTEATSAVTGLTLGTAYAVWFVAEDTLANLQASPLKVGVTTRSSASGYSLWAASHGNQTPGEDFDHDGVANGVEYFMGAADGFTANPGVVNGKVRWPKDPAYDGTYGVQTSSNLSVWTPVAATDNGTSVEYILPPGHGSLFVRLVVTPN